VTGSGPHYVFGNVGIGTTTPTSSLEVQANQNAQTGIRVKNTTSGTSAGVEFGAYTNSGNGGLGKYSTGNTPYKNISAASTYIYNGASGDIALLNDVAAGNISFAAGAASTAQMFISASGYVGIGTTSPVQKLHVEGSSAIGTTGTEDILIIGRALSGGVSFQQAASLKLGRYQNAGGAYESYTRLDIALRDNSAASNYNTNTTVMTLTNQGNVGIGTTSPTGSRATNLVQVAGSLAVLRVGPWFSTDDRDFIELQADGANTKVYSPNEDFSFYNPIGNANITGSTVNICSAGNTRFFNSGSERMIITNSGSVLIGTATTFQNTETLCVLNSTNASIFSKQDGGSGNWVQKIWNNATSGNNNFVEFLTETALTARGSITYNRGSAVVAYNTTSDYRLKSEINDFNALEIVSNLKPKEFRIGDAINKSLGFIAHELQEFLPQAVQGEKDAVNKDGKPIYQSVDYSQLTGLLTKAIQELKAEIDELKNK
jgi:hypothetical protein